MCVQSLNHVRLFVAPWTVAYQAPLSVEFSRQEYWSVLPFPTPGNLPNPGIKPRSSESPALEGRFFTTVPSEVCGISKKFHPSAKFGYQIYGFLKPKSMLSFNIFHHLISECNAAVILLTAKKTSKICPLETFSKDS